MKRDLYWDSLKFVLIFFVVYGHIIAHYSELSRINMATYNYIYLFHMPLFVFVSGRFSHIRDKQKYKKDSFLQKTKDMYTKRGEPTLAEVSHPYSAL